MTTDTRTSASPADGGREAVFSQRVPPSAPFPTAAPSTATTPGRADALARPGFSETE